VIYPWSRRHTPLCYTPFTEQGLRLSQRMFASRQPLLQPFLRNVSALMYPNSVIIGKTICLSSLHSFHTSYGYSCFLISYYVLIRDGIFITFYRFPLSIPRRTVWSDSIMSRPSFGVCKPLTKKKDLLDNLWRGLSNNSNARIPATA
jgi:hypothetical protein